MPKVTVLMPVYNAEKHLSKALESILNQTFTDFEFLIIDDCSTDSTPAILDRYADPRIVRHRNPRNLGIVDTLNRGLELAQGEYIARMDADDIAYPDRLRAQVEYLDRYPEVVLLGTKYVHIDDDGEYVYGGEPAPPPPEPGTRAALRWSLLWMTSIQHPTAMMRRETVLKHGLRYDKAYETAEDYELWSRFGHYGEVERLEPVLLYYRINPSGISETRRAHQLETHFRITYREISAHLGAPPPEDAMRLLFRLIIPMRQSPADIVRGADIPAAVLLYLHIRDTFLASRVLEAPERAHIRWMTQRLLLKALDYTRYSPDPTMRKQMRALILRHMPTLFARITAEFFYYKLFKR